MEQHEEDLEQTMMMKKQLEKKINEAFEEVDENKKDSAQWKNKYKKVQVSTDKKVNFEYYNDDNNKVEMDETRIMLEEQNEKNGLLERKFRKVDSELMEVIYSYKQIIDFTYIFKQIQQEILREANIRSLLEKDMDVLRHEKARLTEDIHVIIFSFIIK